jgi:hypothetical protein
LRDIRTAIVLQVVGLTAAMMLSNAIGLRRHGSGSSKRRARHPRTRMRRSARNRPNFWQIVMKCWSLQIYVIVGLAVDADIFGDPERLAPLG